MGWTYMLFEVKTPARLEKILKVARLHNEKWEALDEKSTEKEIHEIGEGLEGFQLFKIGAKNYLFFGNAGGGGDMLAFFGKYKLERLGISDKMDAQMDVAMKRSVRFKLPGDAVKLFARLQKKFAKN